MGKLTKIGYSLQDVSIIPARITEIRSRKEVNPYTTICNRGISDFCCANGSSY